MRIRKGRERRRGGLEMLLLEVSDLLSAREGQSANAVVA